MGMELQHLELQGPSSSAGCHFHLRPHSPQVVLTLKRAAQDPLTMSATTTAISNHQQRQHLLHFFPQDGKGMTCSTLPLIGQYPVPLLVWVI